MSDDKKILLIQALANLCIDPFPTKTFQEIINQLKNFTTIMEEANERRFCCTSKIFSKLSLNENSEFPQNAFVSNTKIWKILTQMQVPQKVNSLLIKLLNYIVIKLERCNSEDAAEILHDFNQLQFFIFKFRKYSTWDNKKFDEIMIMFVEKLIKNIKELTVDWYEQKFHLFNIMKIMITEFGKSSVFCTMTVKLLTQEVKRHYENPKQNSDETNEYVIENFLSYLFILNDIIGKNFLSYAKEESKIILTELKHVLEDDIQEKRCSREAYIVQNILRVIEVHLSTIP